MGKKLQGMSLEELWELFPIILTEHKDVWDEWYVEEKTFLESILPDSFKIHHIGSTVIKNIWAKPIIDMLIEIPKNYTIETVNDILIKYG